MLSSLRRLGNTFELDVFVAYFCRAGQHPSQRSAGNTLYMRTRV